MVFTNNKYYQNEMTTMTSVLLHWIIRANLTAFQSLQLLCLSVVALVREGIHCTNTVDSSYADV